MKAEDDTAEAFLERVSARRDSEAGVGSGERRFRAAVDSMHDATAVISPLRHVDGEIIDFRFEYANDAYCAMVGLDQGRMLGQRLGELIPGYLDAQRFEECRQVLLTGEPRRTEDVDISQLASGVPLAGSRVLDVSIAPMGENLVVSARDVTARRTVEAELRASEQRFRAAVESMLDAFTIFSPVRDEHGTIVDFRFDYINDAACTLISIERERLLGHRLGELFPGYPNGQRFALYRQVSLTGRPVRSVDVASREAFAGTALADRLVETVVVSMGGSILVSARDVTEITNAAAELELRGQLLDLAHDAVIVRDPDGGQITYWNREAEAVYGYSAGEAVGRAVHELLATEFPESMEAVDEALAEAGQWHGELRHTRKDRTVIVVASRQALKRDADGIPVAIIELNSDVTVRRQAEQINRRLAAVVQSTHDAVLTTDAEGTIVDWNRGAQELYGYTAAEAIGQPARMLNVPELAAGEAEVMRRVAAGESVDQYESLRLRKDGARVLVSLTISPIRDDGGRVVAAASISRDVSDRKRHEDELAHLADHDSLTGLFNRRRFEEELERELERARRDGSRGALLAIDLDHFKSVNDSLGHHAGDQLISQTAEIFTGRLRATDVIARLGGDEFAVLLRGVDEREASSIAATLLETLSADVAVPGGVRRVTASIGIAPFKAVDQLTAEDLFVEADIAMYDAKEAGRARAAVYSGSQDRHRRLGSGISWADRIREALRHDRFVLHAQPVVSLCGDGVPRHELLVRMLGDGGAPIAPEAFLHVAERMKLLAEIDRWVLRKAIETLARERRSGADVRLHVNLSAVSVADPGLPGAIADELETAGADGRGLCLEVAETTAIVNLGRAQRFAASIAELGCELALDDFGAGYASFYYLKHLPFDYLKIDGEFIENIAHNPTDHLLVQTLAAVARTLGRRTIAEHVSDHQSIEMLRSYDVDYVQGFYVAAPAPLEQAELTRAKTVRA